MVHLVEKKRKGHVYLYLEERARINGKSTRLWQKYLGSKDKIREMNISLSPQKIEYQTLEFGISAALLQIAKKIGFVDVIDSIAGKKRKQNLSLGEYLLIATINRCVAPTSKRKLGSWFGQDYLSTVFNIDSSILNSQTYWNHFQFLDEETLDLIELELTKHVLKEYQLNLQCLLFDPTNFFTFIEEHSPEQLAKFGKSKEGRNNLRLINLSLICTLEDGIPLFHQTYEGNIQDAKHFKGIISKFTKRFKQLSQDIEELVLIFDKGNHSVKAFRDIDAISLPFIASLRNSTQKDLLILPEEAFTMIELPSNGKKVGYYRTQREIYEIVRTVYVLFDPRKHKRAVFQFEKLIQKRLNKIANFLPKLNIKKWRSKEAVEKKLRKLIGKEPYSKVLLATVKGSFGKLMVDIVENEEEKTAYALTLGRSIIFTSQDNWAPITIIQAFRDKYVVEDAFKYLKDPHFLAIRPMYHWSNTCIRAHVFSCLLGLLLLSLVRKELKKKSIFLSYKGLLNALLELKLTQIYTSSKASPFYKLNRISPLTKKIFTVLKLKSFLPR